MRFDDSLTTILAADVAAGSGADAAWRQLVDLIGRGRVPAADDVFDRLAALRDVVPVDVRAATARALATLSPPVALVAFFARDEPVVAAALLRTVALAPGAWLDLLPGLGPTGRAVLRHRRDLSDTVCRALEAFGSVDFVLAGAGPDRPPVAAPVDAPVDAPIDAGVVAGPAIADLVARIDAYHRDRPVPDRKPATAIDPPPAVTGALPDSFTYETDATGTIRFIDAADRAALIGVSLARAGGQGTVRVDAVAAGALRQRQRFADARLEMRGLSMLAGSWRLSGVPAFDPHTGRFTGMRGVARRARRDQEAASPADALRQLVHELRTPAHAIMGFAELIGSELLGPVPAHYRERADAIHAETSRLVGAIDDLDMAARIDGQALDLRADTLAVAPLLARVAADLMPLAAQRGVTLAVDAGDGALPPIAADARAAERLIARLVAAIVAAGSAGETIRLAATTAAGAGAIALAIDRPAALATDDDATLFRLDAAAEEGSGAPLLGIGFTLRLARNLAAELGGALLIASDRLTLRLPAAVDRPVEQAAN